jgi:predicted SAM-dependent methyltransferase
MKLNLGCGSDIRHGYVNVDAFDSRADIKADLSTFPWPWSNETADEILMLDFLEHFPYSQTNKILLEVCRILKFDGHVDIQVPDFEHCARAAIGACPFLCNRCGFNITDANITNCPMCNEEMLEIINSAIHRLYGGQDRHGNWHHTAFTKNLLVVKIHDAGLDVENFLEEEHQYANWNFKVRARKLSSW